MRKRSLSRRDFMRNAMAAGAALGGLTVLGATPKGTGKVFKVGLVGCGGRGSGALAQHVNAAKILNGALGWNIQIKVVATADYFKGRAEGTGRRHGVPKDMCFGGATAYKKLLDTDIDIMLTAAPPAFRPVHFEAAIKAGKHVFMEKPVAVDPVGCQAVIAAGEAATEKKLSVVAGTQRRHDFRYLQTYELVKGGAIGPIRGGAVWWCGTQLWSKPREQAWGPREYMVKNWINFVEMSGDHIVEQHVHNIDVANWFLGTPPWLAVGFGGRMRRKTGNQFDFFSVDYQYKIGPDGKQRCHIHSMSRQINGCWGREAEELIGEEGYASGTRIRRYDKKKPEKPDIQGDRNPYVQEHIDLLKSIVGQAEPLNETAHVVEATLTGIMGRISAYTGEAVRYSDIAEPGGRFGKFAYKPGPLDFEAGEVEVPEEGVAPIPGSD